MMPCEPFGDDSSLGDELRRQFARDHMRRRNEQLEDRVVRQLAKTLGQTASIRGWLRTQEDSLGTKSQLVRYASLLAHQPALPGWLVVRHSRQLSQVGLTDLLDPKKAKRTHWYQTFQKAYLATPDERPLLLVLASLARLPGRYVVAYAKEDADRLGPLPERQSSHVVLPFEQKELPGMTLVLEPWQVWLGRVGSFWQQLLR